MTPMHNLNNRALRTYLLAVVILAICSSLPWIFNKPFYTKGEPREILTARAMLDSGNWIIPQRIGDELPTKPPLAHWLIATAALAAGNLSEGVARLPSAVFAIAATIALSMFLAARTGHPTGHLIGLLSSLVLMTCLEWNRAAVTCRLDMPFSVLLFFSLLQLFCWEERKLKDFPLVCVITLSLATLAKGPAALLLPALIFGCYLLALGWPLTKIIRSCAPAFLAALLLPAVWYAAAYYQQGDRFLQIVLAENVGRAMGDMGDGDVTHEHSALYMLFGLSVGLLPWVIVLVYLPWFSYLRHLPGNLSRILAPLFNAPVKYIRNALIGLRQIDKFFFFSVLAILAFLAFFSFVPSKRSVYLLPIFPFMAYLIAHLLSHLYNSHRHVLRRSAITLLAIVTLLQVIVAIVIFSDYPLTELLQYSESLARKPSNIALLNVIQATIDSLSIYGKLAIFLPTLLACLVFALLATCPLRLYYICGVAYFTLLLYINGIAIPAYATIVTPSHFAATIQTQLSPNEELYSYGDRLYGVSFYLDRDFKDFVPELFGADSQPQTTADWRQPKVILLTKKISELQGKLPAGTTLTVLAESVWGPEKPKDKVSLVELNRVYAK